MTVLSLKHFLRKAFLITVLTMAALGLPCSGAFAHAVFIFAWVDGGQICTESYFSKKTKVRGGTVRMFDDQGRELQSGITDEQGALCFAPPAEQTGLVFVIEAGEGHRGQFSLTAADLNDGVLPAATEALPALPLAKGAEQAPARLGPPIDESALRSIIREELQAQLAPINKSLAKSGNGQRPGWHEAIGGLGWLAGLAGFALWRASRKK